jgi:hypothetical protein
MSSSFNKPLRQPSESPATHECNRIEPMQIRKPFGFRIYIVLQGGNKAIWQVIFGLDTAKLFVLHCAGVAKLADAQDLKSWAP